MQLRSANVVLPGVSLRLLLVLTPLAAQAWQITMRTGSVYGCIPAQGTSIQVIQGSDNSCHNFGSGDSATSYGPDTECVQMAYSNTAVEDVAIPIVPPGPAS